MVDSISGKGLPNNIQELLKARSVQSSASFSTSKSAETKLSDQISLSDDTKKSLETLKNLDKQLTRFLDVLKGRRSTNDVLAELKRDGNGGFDFGLEDRTALSIKQINAIRETTALSADINNEGELDLVLTNVRTSLSSTNISLSSQQNSYLAALSS